MLAIPALAYLTMDKEQRREAGRKRTEGLSTEERKSLATKAAHARWRRSGDGVAIATHEGEITLGAMSLPCAVLKDGRRIFSERGLSKAFTHVRSGNEFKKRAGQQESERLPVFITAKVASFLIPSDHAKLIAAVRYRRGGADSIPAWGVDASLLPALCEAYLAARDAGALETDSALRKARAAEVMIRALAKVGVIALIDEATGFQVERDRDELQTLLTKYVSEEHRLWMQKFPTEFYVELFRLRNVKTDDVRKRPRYFGKLTNELVYERLLPGMLPKLESVNPIADDGRRARKHHQHLVDQGEEHLKKHLTGLVYLMKASASWPEFIRALDRAAPIQVAEVEEGAETEADTLR